MQCNKCGSTSNHAEVRGVHTGLYCDNCGSWIKWLSKKEIDGYEKQGSIRQPRDISNVNRDGLKMVEREEHTRMHEHMGSGKVSTAQTHRQNCVKSGWVTPMVNGITECCQFNCGNARGMVHYCPVCGRFITTKDEL